MDNTDIFIKPEHQQTEEQPPEKPRKNQRKPMTPERKEILLENLRKGRAKYKQQALAIKEQLKTDNNEVVNDIKPNTTEQHKEIKYNSKADIDELKQTLNELKEMLNKFKKEEKPNKK